MPENSETQTDEMQNDAGLEPAPTPGDAVPQRDENPQPYGDAGAPVEPVPASEPVPSETGQPCTDCECGSCDDDEVAGSDDAA